MTEGARRTLRSRGRGWLAPLALVLAMFAPAQSALATKNDVNEPPPRPIEIVTDPGPKLDERCTVSVQNRTVQVRPDGAYLIPNVPVDVGLYRVRAICLNSDGTTVSGQTDYFELQPPSAPGLPSRMSFGQVDPIPVSLALTAPVTTLSRRGETTQITVTGTMPDGTTRDLSTRAEGTTYATSNGAIASVDDTGRVTVFRRGRVVISARNEGVVASILLDSIVPDDADADGLPDAFESANGLDPNDPTDAAGDRDGDGLTNLREFELGTSVGAADSDGDGLPDADEIGLRGTDPTDGDTDGDGLLDGEEFLIGTNPIVADSDADGLADGLEVDLGFDPKVVTPTTTVTGSVIDANGAAAAGAAATVAGRFTATADATGAFSIANVPANQGDLVVEARRIVNGVVADGETAPLPPVAGGTTNAGTISLAAVIGRVSGIVANPRGVPVLGAAVTLRSGSDVRLARTDVTGAYRFDQVPPGALAIEVVDPRSQLRGRRTTTLASGASAAVDVALSAAGAIVGRVLRPDGATPVGAGTTVQLAGPISPSVVTDALSEFRFDFLPLGSYGVDVSDAAGNRGRADVTLTRTAQVATADVVELGRGTVQGRVETATGALAAGASVSLSSASFFGGFFSVTTGASGTFTIPSVFVGSFFVSARDASSHLGGATSGALQRDGDVADVVISLQPAGTIVGTVFEADGATPSAGAVVDLTGTGRRTVADAAGAFRLDAVPLGSYAIDVTQPATGDRGRGAAVLDTADAQIRSDISLNGFGAVTVRVEDFGGVPVPGATVRLGSQTIFGGTQTGSSDAAGEVHFAKVLAGPFSISAFEPIDQLGGAIESSVLRGENVTVPVRLEASGDVVGTIFAPDGTTPAPNVRVRLSPLGQELVTTADGRYRFAMVPIARGPYTVDAFVDGVLAARAANIVLGAHDEVQTRDLVLAGKGSAQGVVTNADGSGAPLARVEVTTLEPGSLRLFANADCDGRWSVNGIPVARFRVTVRSYAGAIPRAAVAAQCPTTPATAIDASNVTAAAGANGTLAGDGDVQTLDLALLPQIPAPPPGAGVLARLYDANGFGFAIHRSGRLEEGALDVFRGDGSAERGAAQLVLTSGGVPAPFDASGGAGLEENGRELVIQGPGAAGLDVTRKVYVPVDGYFARGLELLHNPGSAPITTDVELDGDVRYFGVVRPGFATVNEAMGIVATSSGDGFALPGDQWLILDDRSDVDPFLSSNSPSVGFVFDGVGAARAADEVSITNTDATGRTRLRTVWRDVVVSPGGSVAFLHFTLQQTGRAQAQASVNRLAQLPPEALVGLSASELAALANFAPPPGGVSALAALPPITGVVNGRALEGDGVTPVGGAPVTFRSASLFFGRERNAGAASNGTFAFTGAVGPSGTFAIPVEDYTLRSRHPASSVSVDVPGAFDPGSSADVQDVVFDTTGRVAGLVRRADGAIVTSGTVRLLGGALTGALATSIGADGSYGFNGVPAGTYTLTASLPNPGGSELAATTSATVTPPALTTADITFAATGGVTGVVRDGGGLPQVRFFVALHGTNFSRSGYTDTGGRFRFLDVPAGDYELRVNEPRTALPTVANVTVPADGVVSQDLTLVGVGRIEVEARFSDGTPVANATVLLRRDPIGAYLAFAGTTDANGRRLLGDIPAGDFLVRVYHPRNGAIFRDVAGTFTTHGATQPVPVSIPVDEPPSVTLTAPLPGATAIEGVPISLAALAGDDRAVSRVEFLIDGAVVGTDFGAPHQVTAFVPHPATGSSVSVTARAIDDGSNVTISAPVLVTVLADTTAPVVTLTSPTTGTTLREGQRVFVAANATDDIGVASVSLSANGAAPFATANAASTSGFFQIPATYASGGITPIDFTASVLDRSGNPASATKRFNVLPDDPPLLFFGSGPANGTNVIEGTTVVYAVAAVDDVFVASVDLLVNGALRQTRTASPYTFSLTVPPATTTPNPIEVSFVARDGNAQTSAPVVRTLQVIPDLVPQVALTAPTDGASLVEGSPFLVAATASDDVAIVRVDFLLDGVVAASDASAPYAATLNLPGGVGGSNVEVRAVAVDTRGQTASDARSLVRLDDTAAPTISLTSPRDGASFSAGEADVAILVDTSARMAGSVGFDVDGDATNDSILAYEIAAAKQLVDLLDPTTTRISVIDIASFSVIVRSLTNDFASVRAGLDAILAAGAGGSTSFSAGLSTALSELGGQNARTGATPVVLLLSDGVAAYPSAEATRAVEAGAIVSTFAVGPSADPTALQLLATTTGGTYTRLTTLAELGSELPGALSTGIDGIPIVASVTDDAGVDRVTFRVHSQGGSVDRTLLDDTPPFNAVFSSPSISTPLALVIDAVAVDFAGNTTAATPVNATLLPANAAPTLLRLSPATVAVFDTITINGRFFSPIAGQNVVTVGGATATPFSASKFQLFVTTPPNAASGPVMVTVNGVASNALSIVLDRDRDGLSDEQEAALGTSPTDSDSDDDTLSDGAEVNTYHSDPLAVDTDGDGIRDGTEVSLGLSPTNPADAAGDLDTDGLSNVDEIGRGTNPRLADTDGDGLLDGREVATTLTNPLLRDTDGGGRDDGAEVDIDGTDPLNPADDVPAVNLPFNLFDVASFRWDVSSTGQMNDGTSDAYDGGLVLRIDSASFPGFTTARREISDRQLVIGPAAMGSLSVSRKIYVPADAQFARFLELLENPTASDVTVTLEIYTNLGSDGSERVRATSSGDATLSFDDDWIYTDDGSGGDPGISQIFSGPLARVSPSTAQYNPGEVRFSYVLTVPAGGRIALLHFASQDYRGALAQQQTAEDLAALRAPRALFGLDLTELADIVNFQARPDADGDGLADEDELAAGTDPNDADSDDDGMPDGFEVRFGLNPLLNDAADDADSDGLSNAAERTAGTAPNDADTDDDGLQDGDEIARGTNPRQVDTDGDTLTDGNEVNVIGSSPLLTDTDGDGLTDPQEVNLYLTSPVLVDTDGDTIRDNVEVQFGLNPRDPADALQDRDGDGLSNLDELQRGTNLSVADSDGDGLGDGLEVNLHGTNPLQRDTDGGSAFDGEEVNTDGTDPLDPTDDFVRFNLPATLTDLLGFRWDVGTNGGIGDGSNDAYDGGLNLQLRVGVATTSFSGASRVNTALAGRELLLGPIATSSGLTLQRRIYVPLTSAFARFVEVVENPTAASIDATVIIATNLGSDGGESFVQTSSGDAAMDVLDDWIVTDDVSPGGDPTVTHVFSGPSAPVDPSLATRSADNIRFEIPVTVPAGGRVAVLHFAAQASSPVLALPLAIDLGALLPSDATAGLSAADRAAIQNFQAQIDTDADGLPDDDELLRGTDPARPDTDGDTLRDGFEVRGGLDPLVPDDPSLDPDGDGLTTGQEQTVNTNPTLADTDFDGLDDGAELAAGTNPRRTDTDGDGLRDGFEVLHGFDPLLPVETNDDPDSDGLSNLQEQAAGTNPNDPDTDHDGIPDQTELNAGLDPLDPSDASGDLDGDGLTNVEEIGFGTDLRFSDTDGDGLGDGEEVRVHATSPTTFDTDSDGIGDGAEVANGLDPLDPADANLDPDADGLTNREELNWGTSLTDPDTDGDALTDGFEANSDATSPTDPDSDFGGRSDGAEELIDGTSATNSSDDVPRDSLAYTFPNAPEFTIDYFGHIQGNADPENRFSALTLDGVFFDAGPGDVALRNGGDEIVAGPFRTATGLIVWRQYTLLASRTTVRIATVLSNLGLPAAPLLLRMDGGGTSASFFLASTGAPGLSTRDSFLATADGLGNTWTYGFAGVLSRARPSNTFDYVPGASGSGWGIEWNVALPADGATVFVEYVDLVPLGGDPRQIGEAHRVLAGDETVGLADPDRERTENFPLGIDDDGDRLSNAEEAVLTTDPLTADSDGDLVLDGFEVRGGLNPLDPLDDLDDVDADGLGQLEEQTFGTNPLDVDTDGDGVTDFDEVFVNGTDPLLWGPP